MEGKQCSQVSLKFGRTTGERQMEGRRSDMDDSGGERKEKGGKKERKQVVRTTLD